MKRRLLAIALLSIFTASCLDATDEFDNDTQDSADGKADNGAPARSIAAAITGKRFALKSSGLSGADQPYKSNGSYVAMNLLVAPYADVKAAVQAASGVNLKSRGEAHITVLTPPEFGVIGRLVPMNELDALAKSSNLQRATITAKCLGVGKKQNDQAVFLVVESVQLMAYRTAVATAFVARGGSASAFNPGSFHPHVTVGFTKRDLHESDGVIKSTASCPNIDNIDMR
jgi:2'-5' RNA ligase